MNINADKEEKVKIK